MNTEHYHACYEIYYMLSGERYYFIKDSTFHVKKGDLVIINKYELHRTTCVNNPIHERIVINFKDEFLKGHLESINDIDLLNVFKQDMNVIILNINHQNYIESLLLRMVKENQRKTHGYYTYLKLMLMELLVFIGRYSQYAEVNKIEHPGTIDKKISDVARYINENYMHDVSLNSVAQIFYVSPFYLSKMFKKVTGFNFVEYINHVRIKEAQKILRGTKLSVPQVVEKVGFDSIPHFGRVFKKICGVSPLQYRSLSKERNIEY